MVTAMLWFYKPASPYKVFASTENSLDGCRARVEFEEYNAHT